MQRKSKIDIKESIMNIKMIIENQERKLKFLIEIDDKCEIKSVSKQIKNNKAVLEKLKLLQ
jgi:hypothetical protein